VEFAQRREGVRTGLAGGGVAAEVKQTEQAFEQVGADEPLMSAGVVVCAPESAPRGRRFEPTSAPGGCRRTWHVAPARVEERASACRGMSTGVSAWWVGVLQAGARGGRTGGTGGHPE